MIEKKSWSEFSGNGLLWWINMILHTFGWAIVVEEEGGKIIDVYPARVKYRGFTEKCNEEGYVRVSRYMKNTADALLEESKS